MAKIGCGDLPPEEGDGGIGRKGKGVWSRRHRRSGGLRPRREDGPRVEGFLQKAEEQVELTFKENYPAKMFDVTATPFHRLTDWILAMLLRNEKSGQTWSSWPREPGALTSGSWPAG